MVRKMELLSPAGDMEAMRAAVANGADAVYFGLASFNARHRAENVGGKTLAKTLEYLHAHNVRGYVAFNTLIFSGELAEAAKCIRQIAAAGADAVIVQDIGLLHLIRAMAPTLAVHASTQMTLSDARGIEVVTGMGIGRVILARELAIADIRKITMAVNTEVEVFCHGALCVAYSGQCLTSESIGGRSANRGQCAQACRLPYEMVVDGEVMDAKGKQFLLSPQDLGAYDRVGELAETGVGSLKIEGRLKSAEYVAATTSAYREAIEAAADGRPFALTNQREAQLKQSFSRGFTHGFLDGANHQELVEGSFSKKRGVRIGTVIRKGDGVVVRLERGQAVKPGDGIVFDEGHPEQDEQGGRVYEVRPAGAGGVELRFGRGAIATSAISAGAQVWKTDDPAINRELEKTYSRDVVVHRERLSCAMRAVAGEVLEVRLRDERGREGVARSEQPMELARRFPLDERVVREQFGRLGDTPFELGEVRLSGKAEELPPEPVMAPKSVLNELRRAAVADLMGHRDASHAVTQKDVLGDWRAEIAQAYPLGKPDGPARITVLVRTMEQLRSAIAWSKAETIWCEFEDVRRYAEAVQVARQGGARIGLATMRITKPGEDGFLNQMAACQPDAVLVRNLSALAYFSDKPVEIVGDYSLNVTNELTAWALLRGSGWRRGEARLLRLTPGHDLNATQLDAMLGRIGGRMFEMVLHQQMPMFHMEHCVFAHMLSNGRDFHDCGRPCERHQVSLRDRVGVAHPLVADAGCRNTVYNGRAQSIAGYLPKLRELGVEHFRIELLRENAGQTSDLLEYYWQAANGKVSANRPGTRLKVLDLMGVTPGTMEFE